MNKIINKNKIILAITATTIAGFSVFFATAGIFKPNTQVVNDLKSGLIGYFTFDGQDTNWGTATTSDKSGGGYNGIMVNLSTSTSPTAGLIGQALKFDGNGDYVTAANANTTGLDTITMTAWIKRSGTSVTGYESIIETLNSNFDEHYLVTNCNDNLIHFGYTIDYATTAVTISNSFVTDGNWHHLTGTYDRGAGQLKIYVDGILRNTASASGDVVGGGRMIVGGGAGYTGCSGSGDDQSWFNGIIDEPRIYNRALSANEITELYNQGVKRLTKINTNQKADIVPSGLTGYWTFDGPDVSWTGATSGTVNNRGSVGGVQTLTGMNQLNSPIVGKIGQALNFQADNQNINTAITAFNFITANEGTISVWMKPSLETRSNTNVFYLPVVVGDGYDGWYGIHVGLIGGLNRIWIYNYNANEDRIGVEYTPNEWVHIIWKHEGGNLYAFKNGSAVGSVASGNTGGGGNFRIGHSINYKGSIDEVRIYNRALSQIEITELYNQGEKNLLKVNMPQTDLIPSSLVGYWTFNGRDTNWGANITNDRSGNNNTGTMTNMSTSSSPVAGIFGQALRFDNINDRVVLSAGSVATTLNDFTASVWVKPENPVGKQYQTVMGFGGSGDELFFGLKDGKIVLFSSDFSPNEKVASTVLSTNTWQYIVFTRSGANYNFYLNGASDGSGTWVSTAIIFNNSFRGIGNDDSSGEEYLGALDELRVYNRALSASEVMELYRAGAGL